ncbi:MULTISPECIES: carboxy terminal-processing peptidase [Idiomarina]|uniref:carboxy terminal-processing peptidase n=1 Tax=Idiomarina TaxID=135575 RepID=UPI00129B8034|nr:MULTISPECIES: carboxy terminal-processing peptidase [Idiomarina]MRJ40858.1 carboxy terminal-processing peptidase [Idiomarina sp. FeN1]NCU56662.1 carboxy terminal-processing peptidase [Idiomarina sp. FenA--70]NCU59042.1 carboxy terminal-processing peptidase [Idiomarina sp. FenBw--71]UUN14464.1 carboxy terminal-processing peptidase [Idiomarina loihiensis]
MSKKGFTRKAIAVFIGLSLSHVALALPPAHQLDELPELAPAAQHGVASQRVKNFFTRYHFKQMELDNELSEQILERYLEMLDYNKMFLLATDIEQAQEYRLLFDDMIDSGKLSPAFSLYQKSLQRRFERYSHALSLLDEEHPFDFTETGDKYHFQREDADWPAAATELDELWRQRVKYDALNLTMAGKEWPEVVETLGKRYNNALKRLTQTKSEDVFQTVMNAFARSVEAHTSYLSPVNSERFEQNMNLSLEGIGAVLQADYDYTVIRSLVPGGPADKSGQVAVDDKIVGVAQGDDDDADFVDVIGWRLDDVVELIKGPKGTTVKLQVLKANQSASATPKEVMIVRDKVKLEDRAAKIEIKQSTDDKYDGRATALITIPGFYNNLTTDVVALLEEAAAANVESLIIDLRGNGGGSLAEAISLTGLFIDQGPVVQVADGSGRKEVNGDRDGKTFYNGPMVVMVDRYSASASEIFAAALQDYNRAVIVGENTYGKGTVQQHRGIARPFDFYDEPLGSVQYTMAKFYRINGGSTQLRGVQPDLEYPSIIDAEEFGESSQENALPWDQITPAKYQTTHSIRGYDFKTLQQQLDEQIQGNPEFNYIFADIERYQQEKEKTWVSLVLAERKAEEAADKARNLARANERLQRLGQEPVEKIDEIPTDLEAPDPYLEETVELAFRLVDQAKMAAN